MYVVARQVIYGCAKTIGNHRVLVISGVHVCARVRDQVGSGIPTAQPASSGPHSGAIQATADAAK